MAETGDDPGVDPFDPAGERTRDEGEAGAGEVVEATPEELEQIIAAEKEPPDAQLVKALAEREQEPPQDVITQHEPPEVLIGELVEEEEPPDETQPLLPAVNKSVGPETAVARAERYRLMHQEALAELEAGMPEDSVWASFIRNERERDARMEPIRAAFIKSMQSKGGA